MQDGKHLLRRHQKYQGIQGEQGVYPKAAKKKDAFLRFALVYRGKMQQIFRCQQQSVVQSREKIRPADQAHGKTDQAHPEKVKALSQGTAHGRQGRKSREKAELEKEKQIRQELEARRKKRRREEKEYALKELSQDGKDSVNKTVSSMLSAASPSADVSALTGMDGAMVSGDLGGIDLGGLDLMA